MTVAVHADEVEVNRRRSEAQLRRRLIPKTCDTCGETSTKVLRFYLSHNREQDGVKRGYGAGSILLCQDCWKRTGKRCDRCGVADRRDRTVKRYSLSRYVYVTQGKKTSRGSGAVFLCQGCWQETGGQRGRPHLRREDWVA